MRFNIGDKFAVWMLDNYAWLDITSYKNNPSGWTLEELKKSLYDQMVETSYAVEEVKPLRLNYLIGEIFILKLLGLARD